LEPDLHVDGPEQQPLKVRAVAAVWMWPGIVIALGTLIRIPQLWHGLNEDHAFRQTQTAFVALEYARHGINLLHTPLPIFGPQADVPMEFPWVQAIAALLIRVGIGPDSAMRIVALVGFQATAVLLTVLILRWHGRLAAIVAIVLFEFSPFALAWGAASLIDFPAVACSLGMVVGLDSWFRSGSRIALVAGAVSAWLAFLVKVTTPPAWCVLVLVSAGTAYLALRSWRRIAVGLLAGPAVGVVLAGMWTRYTDTVKAANPSTGFLRSSVMHPWNFGTSAQRLDPDTYGVIFGRVFSEMVSVFGLILVMGIVLAPPGVERTRRAGWLATAVIGPMVFINLYFVHTYYLIAIFPAIVAAVALGIAAVAERVRVNAAVAVGVGVALVLAGSAAQGWRSVRQWWTVPPDDPAAQAIKAATAPDDLLVMIGCDWDPHTLYFADRRGLMFPGIDYHHVRSRGYMDPGVWSREHIDDYSYLFSCDPSLDPARYLPSGRSLAPTSVPQLWRIVRT
jgi:4-amino-4-deoxy-L-arabinose transferase-like glycosyltransferase